MNRFRRVQFRSAVLGAVVGTALWAGAVPADAATMRGHVSSGDGPLGGYSVTVMSTEPGSSAREVGTATTAVDGSFEVPFAAPADPRSVLYVVATNPRDERMTLASALGTGRPDGAVVVNERTTVATAFAMAQFTAGRNVEGAAPGLQNAAAMTRNLVDPATGEVGAVLAAPPNGAATETLGSFHSLADMVANCLAVPMSCDGLLRLATPPGAAPVADAWQAMTAIAKHPWHNVEALFALSKAGPGPYAPDRAFPPSAWTLALRFVGDGVSMDGPGNMAVDRAGNVWSTNNYEWSPNAETPVCGAENLLKFTPTGQYAPGSPYTGGGLSGAGFGIDIDPDGNVWVGNFGFAAPVPDCPQDRQPPHDSVSLFTPDGRALSPADGHTAGGISRPQGTISDPDGNIWIANCGNDSVTVYPGGDPAAARQLTGLGVTKPFALADNVLGNVFVTGNGSDTVAVLGPDGTPVVPPVSGGGLDKPLGVATDSAGNAWVSNSQVIGIPCPDAAVTPAVGGSLTMIDPGGRLLTPAPLTGGGLFVPWGNAVDGNDNVWVANFAGKRLSQFCGVRLVACRPGSAVGTPISPDVVGYSFDGLTRNTGVVVDQAGNVWVANNWKDIPIQKNPGGYEMVVFVGVAGPVSR
ncbi:hypothetical protein Rruber_04350 [Rhodococcus ruber]